MFRGTGLVCCGLLVTLVAGCEDQKPRPVGNPAGIAPVGVDAANPGGVAPAAAPANAAAPVGNQPAANPPANDGKGIIGKMDARVVDVQQAMAENPNLKVVENKTGGDDPLTFAASAYISARSQASTLGFQHWLKTFKAVEERNPTYAEFTQAMKENRVEFTALYQWQMYGYDSKAGAIVILEDPVKKAEMHKAAGVPLDQ